MSQATDQKQLSGHLKKAIQKLLHDGLIENTISEKPNHPFQEHQLSERGVKYLKQAC